MVTGNCRKIELVVLKNKMYYFFMNTVYVFWSRIDRPTSVGYCVYYAISYDLLLIFSAESDRTIILGLR